MNQKQKYDFSEAISKARKYCAYQERCHSELRSKLNEWGITAAQGEEVITKMIEENFLNEERFARAFARGKHNLKGWGWKKIEIELKKRQISDYCIQDAQREIQTDYIVKLQALLEKKAPLIREKNPQLFRKKLGSYLISKGYEPNVVWELLRDYPK